MKFDSHHKGVFIISKNSFYYAYRRLLRANSCLVLIWWAQAQVKIFDHALYS